MIQRDLSAVRWDGIQDRLRIVYMDPGVLVDILNWIRAPAGQFLALPQIDLPADVVVLDVFPNPPRRALGVLLAHETFEPVATGGQCHVHHKVIENLVLQKGVSDTVR